MSRSHDKAPLAALLFSLASTCLLVAGCASASAVRLGVATFPVRGANFEVPIYESLQDLPRKFVKIGRIVGEGPDSASFRSIVAEMQQSVRELGGDALVLTGGGLLLLKGTDFGVDTDRTVHGVAVRWQ